MFETALMVIFAFLFGMLVSDNRNLRESLKKSKGDIEKLEDYLSSPEHDDAFEDHVYDGPKLH